MAENTALLRNYEITWVDGRVEYFQAQSTDHPSYRSSGRNVPNGLGHIKFYVNFIVVLSIREADVVSIRLLPS